MTSNQTWSSNFELDHQIKLIFLSTQIWWSNFGTWRSTQKCDHQIWFDKKIKLMIKFLCWSSRTEIWSSNLSWQQNQFDLMIKFKIWWSIWKLINNCLLSFSSCNFVFFFFYQYNWLWSSIKVDDQKRLIIKKQPISWSSKKIDHQRKLIIKNHPISWSSKKVDHQIDGMIINSVFLIFNYDWSSQNFDDQFFSKSNQSFSNPALFWYHFFCK